MAKPWYRNLFGARHKSGAGTPVQVKEGDAEAQFHLGLILSNRGEEAQDQVDAAQWYLKAANLNHPLAQLNLGLMYAAGQGVAKDDGAAAMWIGRAAEQGDAGAQFNLGSRCHRSSVNHLQTDAIESRIESYKWFQLAAGQGYNPARAACERVALAMSRNEVTEGDQRVAAFVLAHPKHSQDAQE